jgi:16S rRNA (guanine966-N2)-methyltransferase
VQLPVRVIAGRFRGRSLAGPRGEITRPITDRAKETLFNILGNRFGTLGGLPDFDVLDVFAGTGGLGIEALSRGARRCTFVERDRRAVQCLRDNVREIGIAGISAILVENAWTMRPPTVSHEFGLVFVDPPYRDTENVLRVVDLLERLAVSLTPEGLMVFRHEGRLSFPLEQLRGLRCVDQRTVGRMGLVFLARAAGPSGAAESEPPPVVTQD